MMCQHFTWCKIIHIHPMERLAMYQCGFLKNLQQMHVHLHALAILQTKKLNTTKVFVIII